MKIRAGFVSNSSSSSFMLVTSREIHDKAMATLDEFTQEVVKYSIDNGTKQFCGMDVVQTSYGSHEDSGTAYDIMEDEGVDPWSSGTKSFMIYGKNFSDAYDAVNEMDDAHNSYRQAVMANKGQFIYHEEYR